MANERFSDPYNLTQADIEWFRSCRSLWVKSEAGAPAIFGPGLNPDMIGSMSAEDYETFEHRLEPIQCAFFLHATFGPGRYAISNNGTDEPGATDVTEEDLALFRHTSWRSFSIDSKRPYGRYNDYPMEMATVLGLPVSTNQEGRSEIDPDLEQTLLALHRKSEHVLQAYIEHADLAPGRWLIPFDGWDAIISPRCRPVSKAAIARYEADMSALSTRARHEPPHQLIVPRMETSVALFRSP